MKFEYKITVGHASMYRQDGIALDTEIRDLIARGIKPEEIQVTIEAK